VEVIKFQSVSKSCAHKPEEILCFSDKFSHFKRSFIELHPKTLLLAVCTPFEEQTKSLTDFARKSFYYLRGRLSAKLLKQKAGLV
jgi:hypothetical protein